MATATITDDFSPMLAGDTSVFFAPVFKHKGDGSPVPLSDVTISMKMQNRQLGLTTICSGEWTIDDAVNGQAHYQWQTADVATPGLWTLFVALTNTITGGFVHADSRSLLILEAP